MTLIVINQAGLFTDTGATDSQDYSTRHYIDKNYVSPCRRVAIAQGSLVTGNAQLICAFILNLNKQQHLGKIPNSFVATPKDDYPIFDGINYIELLNLLKTREHYPTFICGITKEKSFNLGVGGCPEGVQVNIYSGDETMFFGSFSDPIVGSMSAIKVKHPDMNLVDQTVKAMQVATAYDVGSDVINVVLRDSLMEIDYA